MQNTIAIFAGIGVLSLFCQWISWRVRLPAIVFLLLSGILAGPVSGWINPSQIFGSLLTPMIALSVAIILFEGGLTLNFDDIREQATVLRNLLTIGVLITAALITLFAHTILHISWEIAALLGAITTVTGPTVIAPLLRTVKPNKQIANILRWEGIVIDPIGAILAILVFRFISIIHGSETWWHTISLFALEITVGISFGVLTGYLLGISFRRHWLPNYLHSAAALIIVIALYAITNIVDDGTGLLAVTIMGVSMANMKNVSVEEVLGFKSSLSILLISGLFILLAAQINFTHATGLLYEAIILLILIQFVVRPLNVFTCTTGSSLTWQERVMLAWIAPRGIIAAAVSALFAIRLKKLGLANAEALVLITFFIIIGTVTFQSLTAGFVARRLGVQATDSQENTH